MTFQYSGQLGRYDLAKTQTEAGADVEAGSEARKTKAKSVLNPFIQNHNN